MKNEKAMCYEKFSIKSKKDGISLIALVITIIVIIIIAAISFSASIGTVEMANYTKIVDNMDKVQVAITEKALDLKGYEAEKGKRRTDGQVYNYVAKGGTTREDFVQIGYEPRYTIIEKDADIGIKLPEIKVNTPDEANVEVTWAVTKDGEIFVWPPYTYKTEKYITKYDKVDESLVGKSGDSDVVIKKKITTITTDDRGRLVNPIVGGSGDNDNPNSGDPSGSGDNPSIVRVKITKPTLQGEYVYTGNIQTADLVNFDPTTMQSIGVTRKNAGTQIITITIKDTTKYEWEDGTTDPLDIEWVMKKQTASVVWGNLSFNYDGTIHIPTASATGKNGETINLSVTGGKSETGTHTAVAVAIGDSAINYELINASTTFTIVKSTTDIISLAITLEKTLYTYSGIANEPKAIIIDGDRTLVQDTDYTLSYENNINVGTATVKIVGIENYVGSVTKNFTIERAKSATVTATDKTYNGLLQAGVTGNNVDLAGAISATQAGTYTATATPKANYAWSDGTTAEKTVSWKILTKSSIDITVTLATTTYTYDGAEKEPTVVVKDKEETLVLNKDYEVKYSDNIDAGTATVTITLKGNYTGTIVKNFIIERAKSATVTATDKTFDGTIQVSVTGTNVDLTGTVAAKEVGTYTANATPKSNYAWSDGTTTGKTLTWKIIPKASSNLTVTLGTTKYTYSGTAKEPTAKVQDGANTLIEGTDYTVSYAKNINVGNATATITLKGNYTGTITQEFEITAKTISVVWTNTSLEYTENELVPTAVVDSGVEGELLNVSVTGAKTLPGTYTATASLDSVVGGQAKVSNYTLINTSTEFEITKGLMVGDYINHTTTEEMVKTDISKTGSDEETITTDTTAKWRVISIDYETGDVLVTTEGAVNSVTLKGASGYLYGASELNRLCERLYSNSTVGVIARSMTIEDLNKAVGYNPTTNSDYKKEYQYTTGEYYTYEENGVTITSETPMVASSSNEVKVKNTYYSYNPSGENSTIGSILVNNMGWLASPCAAAYPTYVHFSMHTVHSNGIGGCRLYNSYGGDNLKAYGLRPVISLNISQINTDDKTKNGITTDLAWNIMGVGITGEEKVGQTLTANISLPADYTVISKQWYSNDSKETTGGTAIANATGDTYLLTSNEANKYVYVVVTAQKADGTTKQFAAITMESVKKTEVSVTLNMESYTYGEEKAIPSVDGNTGNGEVTYYYNTTGSTSEGTNWSTVTSSTSLDAGTYYMYAVINETGSYTGATTNVVEFKVNKKTIETNWGTQILFTYNGKSQAPTATATGATGETINVKVTGAQIDASGTAYTATASIESVTGGGANANNYTLTQTTKEFTISTKLVSAVWTNTSIEYTGGELVPTATAESGVDGETLSLAVTGATTLPGTYTATASIASVEGGQAKIDNYTLANTTTEFEITKDFMIGDYVAYSPTTGTYTTDVTKTGWDSAETLTTVENTKWIVLDIDEATGEVLLVAKGGTNSLYLKDTPGFVYGVEVLNKICKELYSNDELKIVARSLTTADMIKVSGYDPTTYVNPNTKIKYGETSIYTSGSYYAYEEDGKTVISEIPNVASEENPVTIKQTNADFNFYSHVSNSYFNINTILGSPLPYRGNIGWLATQTTIIDHTGSYSGLNLVNFCEVSAITLARISSLNILYGNYTVYPVISLNRSQIDTDDKTKNGITTDLAWNIMGVGITGEEKVGKTLTANISLPADYTVISKQWYSNDSKETIGGTAIANATGDTYLLTSNEANKYVYVVVTAQKADGTTKQFAAITMESVKKTEVSVTLNMESYTYGEEKAIPSVDGNTGNGEVTYYYNTTGSTSEGTNWSTVTSSTSLDAGTYYMYAVINETGSYTGATTNVVEFKVNKKTIETNWGTQILFTYNGKSQAPTATATGATGETINVKVTGAQIDASGTAYTATASIESVTGGGANANNYTLTQTTKEFTISTKLVSVVWTNTSIEYTGGELVPTATAKSGVDGETLSLGVTGAKKLPGTYTATASIASVKGGQAKVDNYVLTNKTKEFEIFRNVKVGDYVNYKLTTAKTVSTLSNKTGAQSETLKTVTNANWRILSINKNTGKILITTEGPVNSVTLTGVTAYFYGASELDRLCKGLYSNTSKGLTARSLTMNDLNEATGNSAPTDNTRYAWYTANASSIPNKTVGKKVYIGKRHQAEFATGVTAPRFYKWDNASGVTQTAKDENGYTSITNNTTPILTTSTFYWYNPGAKNSKINDILGGSATNRGWVASTYMYFDSDYKCAAYGMRTAFSGGTDGSGLTDSAGSTYTASYGLHPVISLNSNLLDMLNTKTNGQSAKTAWNIK